jgi:hypothetical protein
MARYDLYVKLEGHWKLLRTIEASSHPIAFREAMLRLDSAHFDKPIRLEQAEPQFSPPLE